MRRALTLTVALLLLSCSDDDSGSGSTTTAPTSTEAPADSTTASTTSTTEPAPSAIALRGDGLGVVALGAVPDVAVAAITAELGEPSADSGWQPSGSSSFGACPGDRSRSVEWGGLAVLFTDGRTAHGDGEHLSTWRVNDAPPPVATAKGLGYGATAADAEALYPDHVERAPAEDPFPAFLTIDAEGGPITAYLDEADTITNLEAGATCGE